MKTNCSICNEYRIEHIINIEDEFIRQTCPHCLEFKISKSATILLQKTRKDHSDPHNFLSESMIYLLYWMREKNIHGKLPILTYQFIHRLFGSNIHIPDHPTFSERATSLLQEFINRYKPGQSFNIFDFDSIAYFKFISYSINTKSFISLPQELINNSLITNITADKNLNIINNFKPDDRYKITPKGYAYIKDWQTICVICNNRNIILDNNHNSHSLNIIIKSRNFNPDITHQICPYCGEFKISKSALELFNQKNNSPHNLFIKKISGWISEQNSAGATPLITENNLDNILTLQLPSVIDRAASILQIASENMQSIADRFYINTPDFYGISYSTDRKEIKYLINLLKEKKFIALHDDGYEILSQGHIFLDQQKSKSSFSKQAFVAMWFDPELVSAYNDGIETGILKAGYVPVRLDRTEHINSIDDEMIVQIKASKFIVADFTGHRGGVYFEAGFALGLNMPVIWCCRKDHVNDLHFDIRQFNCIDWKTPEELAKRLALRIEAVIGSGPNKLI